MPLESESVTRKKRIDQQPKLTGWHIVPYMEWMDLSGLRNHAITELQTPNTPANYALGVKDKLLGVVAAKKLEVWAQNVLEKAKRFLNRAEKTVGEWSEYNIPFIYSTNRKLIYYLDVNGYYL